MKQMDLRNDQLKEHAQTSMEQYQALEQKVEPFKEQLESFELEKNALLSRTEASKEEVCSFWLIISLWFLAIYHLDDQARVWVLQSSRPSKPKAEDKTRSEIKGRKLSTEDGSGQDEIGA